MNHHTEFDLLQLGKVADILTARLRHRFLDEGFVDVFLGILFTFHLRKIVLQILCIFSIHSKKKVGLPSIPSINKPRFYTSLLSEQILSPFFSSDWNICWLQRNVHINVLKYQWNMPASDVIYTWTLDLTLLADFTFVSMEIKSQLNDAETGLAKNHDGFLPKFVNYYWLEILLTVLL